MKLSFIIIIYFVRNLRGRIVVVVVDVEIGRCRRRNGSKFIVELVTGLNVNKNGSIVDVVIGCVRGIKRQPSGRCVQ